MFCPERRKWDQNQKFTPLSETTSIPPLSYGSPPRVSYCSHSQGLKGYFWGLLFSLHHMEYLASIPSSLLSCKYRLLVRYLNLAVSLSIRCFLFAKSSHFERQVNSFEIYPFFACYKMRPIQILASKTLLVYFASVTVSANGEYM